MAMSKKDFIALAQTLKYLKPNIDNSKDMSQSARDYLSGRLGQWEVTRESLVAFCASQNSAFNRERWLGYIAGKNGPSGGKV